MGGGDKEHVAAGGVVRAVDMPVRDRPAQDPLCSQLPERLIDRTITEGTDREGPARV